MFSSNFQSPPKRLPCFLAATEIKPYLPQQTPCGRIVSVEPHGKLGMSKRIIEISIVEASRSEPEAQLRRIGSGSEQRLQPFTQRHDSTLPERWRYKHQQREYLEPAEQHRTYRGPLGDTAHITEARSHVAETRAQIIERRRYRGER